MVNALHSAKRLNMDCLQVFTKNQRQWRAKPMAEDAIGHWRAEVAAMGWDCGGGSPARIVAHNSYLINLAHPDAGLWRKSVDAQIIEIERCEALGIALCIGHPGAHLSAGCRAPGSPNDLDCVPLRDERAGLKRIIKALDVIHRALPSYRTVTCLETTVGSGTNLGYSFHQLAFIRSGVKQPERVGFCFDTCHVTAAGYDMSTEGRAAAVLDLWKQVCGLETLRAFHLNDSVGALGSRRDRHAHIGQGCCGTGCFRTILNHPVFRTVPKILETPKGRSPGGVEWDLINVRRLRRMMCRADDKSGTALKRAG